MKIFYKRKYPIGSFLNEDIGFEIEIDADPMMDNATIQNHVQILKEMCDQAHNQLNPEMQAQQEIAGAVDYGKGMEVGREVGMTEAINACTSLDVLKTFSLLAKGNPEHKEAYDKKFLELSK